MPAKNVPITNAHSEQSAKELQQLSQSICNIRKIIEAHITEPIEENKELNNVYYLPERQKLFELLGTTQGLLHISQQQALTTSLTDDLLLNKYRTERQKKIIDYADDRTGIALGKIQRARKYQTTPTTGLEDGPLKEYLKNLLARKRGVRGENAIEKKEVNKNKFPYKLPRGTTWEKFIIKFLDDENILIYVGQFQHNANYKDLKFLGRGKKDPKPSEAWVFLKVLAQLNGELSISDPEAKDRYKQQKKTLSKLLCDYFSIDYDPFYPYRSKTEKRRKSYRIKITLVPLPVVPTTENEEDNTVTPDDPLGISAYWDEQTQM